MTLEHSRILFSNSVMDDDSNSYKTKAAGRLSYKIR